MNLFDELAKDGRCWPHRSAAVNYLALIYRTGRRLESLPLGPRSAAAEQVIQFLAEHEVDTALRLIREEA